MLSYGGFFGRNLASGIFFGRNLEEGGEVPGEVLGGKLNHRLILDPWSADLRPARPSSAAGAPWGREPCPGPHDEFGLPAENELPLK
ncbi:MAG: hypothetical protein ACK5Y2_13735 [Bdellovibrionales bacterium]